MSKPSHGRAILFLAALLALIMPQSIAAQQQPSEHAASPSEHALSLTPAAVIARGTPGQSMTQELTISNQTGNAFHFEMVAQDVIVREGKRAFVPAGELADSIAATAVFSQKQVQVPPGQMASVTVTLTLPKQTSVRAMVAIFRGTDLLGAASGAVGMTASLGTLITFVASDHFQASPSPLEISLPSVTKPLAVVAELTNTGTEPIIPEGMLAIVTDAGKLVGKQPFQPQRLLPGERLPFRAEYASELPAGHYRAIASFEFEGHTLSTTSEFAVK